MSADRFPVEAGHIMMYARATGDQNPAYYGALTGAPAAVPPTFVWAASQFDPDLPPRPRPGEPWLGSGRTASGVPQSAIRGGLHAEQRFEYHCPVHEGDVLSVTERAGRTWRKSGRRGGELEFTEKITEYRNQHGELAVVATTVTVHTENVIGSDA
jgi:N-terminal half of MaoC dehydratase